MSSLTTQAGGLSVQHPELWTLQIALHSRALRYILFTDAQPDSLIAGEIPVDSGGERVKAIENAVYDNPGLLDDYGRVRLLVESRHFAVVPDSLGDDLDADRMLRVLFPELDGACTVCRLPECGVKIAFAVPDAVLGFLQRTFSMAPVFHHLHPLCAHYARQCSGSETSRMSLNFRDGSMDVIVFARDRLMLLNTFDVRNSSDAVFMAMNAWKGIGLDSRRDEVQYGGDPALSRPVADELRRYIGMVAPVAFPATAMRLGHDAMRAPLDLVTLALCE